MKVGVFLNYVGLGANLLHLSYCHQIAKLFGPITLITLSKNLDQILEDDPYIKNIEIFDKNKNIIDIPKLTTNLKKLKLDRIYIFYPSLRLFLAAKLAGIKNIFQYPLFKKKNLHLVNAAKKFTCKSLNINKCNTETKIFLNDKKILNTKKILNNETFNIVIGAGSSGFDTRWGEKNYIKLINELNLIDNFYFYIHAGIDQKIIVDNIIENIIKKNCMNLSQYSVRELVPFYHLCDMYVGNDTFLHHVTSQSNKPAVVILLNSPKAYTDYSKNYHRIIPENVDINSIDHKSYHPQSSVKVSSVLKKIIEIKSNLLF